MQLSDHRYGGKTIALLASRHDCKRFSMREEVPCNDRSG